MPATNPGSVLARRYRPIRRIGGGAFGEVFEAEDLLLQTMVAIKLLSAAVRPDSTLVARFRREAIAGILLEHPHIVKVFDVGEAEDGAVFIAMELVRGTSLGDLMATSGPLAPLRALVLARQVLEGLRHAHAQGIVHRDLKPDNLLIATQGLPGLEYETVKICDLGLVKLIGEAAVLAIAKVTQTGVAFGTPAYMAPEQALGRPVDGRSDLYSLAIVLFHMLTGRKPFDATDPTAVMRQQVALPPPPLEDVLERGTCTPELAALVAGALGKRLEERFADAGAMIEALDRAFLSVGGAR